MVAVVPVLTAPVIPDTIPVAEPTVATAALLVLHVPPDVALASVVVKPIQTLGLTVGVMVAGAAVTVNSENIEQVFLVYVMFTVPALWPVTTPLAEPTVATEVLPELHVPPVGAPVRVDVVPSHVDNEPLMPVGSALTVTVRVRRHPVDNV